MRLSSPLLRLSGAVALALFAATAFTPLAAGVSRALELAPRLEPAGAIVVLGGGGLNGDGTLTAISLRRTLHGIDLYQRGLAPQLVFSGPRMRSRFAEGEVRAALARRLGVPASAILTETSARTTHEEARHSAALLLPRGTRRILLVADAQGMRRAATVFAQRGFEPLPAPADDVPGFNGTPDGRLALGRQVLIELTALLYYHAAGHL